MADIISYDSTLNNMLSLLPDTVDKREGSIIATALAPTAFTIAGQSQMLAWLFQNLFIDTAEEEYLTRLCNLVGVVREEATKAIKQINTFGDGDTPLDVPINSKFGINSINYTIKEKIATGQYQAECEQVGTIGNSASGVVLPIDNINNLARAEIVGNPLISARDEENDNRLRARTLEYVRETPFGGNKASYRKATLEIDGVGAVRVFGVSETLTPQKVVVLVGDEQGNKASSELIQKVSDLYNPNKGGLSPIGADVTVSTSVDLPINVTGKIKVKSGESFEIVKPLVVKAVENYVDGVGFNDLTVYYAKLITEMLNASSAIIDVQDVAMNGGTQNIPLDESWNNYQVPTVGTIAITEVI